MNKPGSGGGVTPWPVDSAHMNIASTVDNDAVADAVDTSSMDDVQRLMQQVAAEMNVDAQQAIDSLKKDKDLWNRVERLKQDSTHRRSSTGMDIDAAGTYHFSGLLLL